ncbi:MAG: class II fructose-bisphosphate aldolase [Candidatus Hydrogenedentes bacterium]|nr:class II fructose-bisphosphate aldolase [Candidatus Hydrogenedentota bacterium]
MPLATHETYCAMLDRARAEHFAYPAINVLEVNTLNAALEGFAEAESDGIIAVSIAAGMHTSGRLRDPVLGAKTLAGHARRLAGRYGVNIAIHTDHCPTDKIDTFLSPLLAETAKRHAAGLPPLFQSHMYDGSGLPLEENIRNAVELARRCKSHGVLLEVEAGVVGGEEDGMRASTDAKLYSTPEDMIAFYEALEPVVGRQFMLAATFGNVHGVYKPGHVRLKPAILKEGQDALAAKHGEDARLWLVFHGGSGSSEAEIHETLEYGVVKMNVHTDTQYAFTRGVADHMFRNYDGVVKVDGEVGRKQDYLASTWLDQGKDWMVKRVVEACTVLRSAGRSLKG